MKILIKNGRVVDPSQNIDRVLDILIEEGRISAIDKDIQSNADKVIDAAGKIIMPGLVDMHVHLRQPGREDKETILTGTKAALKGGVTTVLAMPNTEPPIDCAKNVNLVKTIIDRDAQANVFIAGAISKNRLGEEIADIAGLKNKGVAAITDDGSSVDSDELMKAVFKKAKEENILVICHCEDKTLSGEGVVNLGFTSTKLGLRGISKESEYRRVARDIELAAQLGARVHIAHVSCCESVELIAKARAEGVKVTAETAPHYFSLSEESVYGFDTNMKMNPPLRGKKDCAKIKQGLKEGTIDVIASDHAPHTENEKAIEFERAEFGVIGLETELAAAITELIDTGLLSWLDLVNKVSTQPAKILGIDKGTLKVGKDADVVIISPDKERVIVKKELISKSKNSCFLGRKLKGVVEYTIKAGKIAYSC